MKVNGPWMTSSSGMILDVHMAPVAQVLGRRGTGEFRSYGSVIAAAPDMLETLETIVMASDETVAPAFKQIARAAIRKAKPV